MGVISSAGVAPEKNFMKRFFLRAALSIFWFLMPVGVCPSQTMFVLEALRSNADAVLVSGCHIGDCHYIDANYRTRERFEALQKYIEELGIEPKRLRLEWISASEGEKFASAIREMVEDVKQLGPFDRMRLVQKA